MIYLLIEFVSILAVTYYYKANLLLQFGDAASRLDIARKVVDNLTPGLAQLGNLWLPLPQVLMIPFIWNNFLWHSGLAGALMSGLAFFVMNVFIYKTALLFGKGKLPGVIAVLVVMTNINVLYMQTTAMSEVLFISTLSGAIYFLLKWAKNDSQICLIWGALMVSANTLTRYEGYFLAISSILFVVLVSFIKFKKWGKVEGNGIIYSTVALLGIALWSLYLWIIFKNPFYWKDIYSRKVSIISTDDALRKTVVDAGAIYPEKGHLLLSLHTYWMSIANMNGAIITIFGSIILIVFIIYLCVRRNKYDLVVLLLPLSVFIFVVFTLFNGGIPIQQPNINFQTLFDRGTNLMNEYNIRYGLNMVPFLALIIAWFASLNKITRIIAPTVILVQFVVIIFSSYYIMYQLPIRYAQANNGMSVSERKSLNWMKDNYDGGLIMISALKHDPVMFGLGLDYKSYIHEGTGKYWITSRKSPEKYARWIYMTHADKNIERNGDSVTKYVANNPILRTRYKKVFDDDNITIYKIKDKTDL